MKIFWSWQSDRPQRVCRLFVRSVLDAIVVNIGQSANLEDSERPEVDQDTQGEPGLVDISATIFTKINAAAVFVADVTTVAISNGGRRLANPNVLIELGFALKALGPGRIILVANEAFGGGVGHLPFHLRNRRGPFTFNLANTATDEEIGIACAALADEMLPAIEASLGIVVAQSDEAHEPEGRSPVEGDRSLWFPQGDVLQFRDWFGEAHNHEVQLSEGPRSYIRLIPKGWTNAPPSRTDIHNNANYRPEPLGRWSQGDGGLNTDGVLYVGNNVDGRVRTLTQWFVQTGEQWGLDTAIVSSIDGQELLADVYTLQQWEKFLWKGLRFYSALGALPLLKVEVGVVGLEGVRWGANSALRRVAALESDFHYAVVSRDWGDSATISFMLGAYNGLRQAFGLPNVTLEEMQSFLPRRQ